MDRKKKTKKKSLRHIKKCTTKKTTLTIQRSPRGGKISKKRSTDLRRCFWNPNPYQIMRMSGCKTQKTIGGEGYVKKILIFKGPEIKNRERQHGWEGSRGTRSRKSPKLKGGGEGRRTIKGKKGV